MPSFNIVVFAGDYAGPEVWSSTCSKLESVDSLLRTVTPGHGRSSEGIDLQTVDRVHERRRLMVFVRFYVW